MLNTLESVIHLLNNRGQHFSSTILNPQNTFTCLPIRQVKNRTYSSPITKFTRPGILDMTFFACWCLAKYNNYFYGSQSKHTFITVPNAVKVDIVGLFKEKQTQPGIKCVDRNNEKNSNNPSLFTRICVIL